MNWPCNIDFVVAKVHRSFAATREREREKKKKSLKNVYSCVLTQFPATKLCSCNCGKVSPRFDWQVAASQSARIGENTSLIWEPFLFYASETFLPVTSRSPKWAMLIAREWERKQSVSQCFSCLFTARWYYHTERQRQTETENQSITVFILCLFTAW